MLEPPRPNVLFVVMLLLVTLFMCSRVAPSYGADHIYPNPGPVTAPVSFLTHLVDRATLTSILIDNGKDPAADAIAFWRVRPCTIYTTVPSFLGLWTWAGLMVHEIKHCIYGAFHD